MKVCVDYIVASEKYVNRLGITVIHFANTRFATKTFECDLLCVFPFGATLDNIIIANDMDEK